MDKRKIETSEITEVPPVARTVSQSIDWYHPGESRVVNVGGVQVTVRFVGRKGRRGRIAITAPAGVTISAIDQHVPSRPVDHQSP